MPEFLYKIEAPADGTGESVGVKGGYGEGKTGVVQRG